MKKEDPELYKNLKEGYKLWKELNDNFLFKSSTKKGAKKFLEKNRQRG